MARRKSQYGLTAEEKRAAQKWGNDNIGKAQRKHLNSKIESVRSHRWTADDDSQRPKEVQAAQKIVDAWERKREAEWRKRCKAIETACAKAERAVLFSGSANLALAAVRELEAKANAEGWLDR